ncbi:uncharacterized protein LOC135946249 isoform X2 [Cloeon dipterum]|uniref:uncharacterized protein LOC135946249 isoform X2 n=1 Tax=Cloeon dipterum TaxID=197152 RepID=UPI003220A09F
MSFLQLILLITGTFFQCAASCFFAPELQGEFVMQSSVSAEQYVQYSQVNITSNSIPIWGSCHKRIKNNVILMDNSGGENCFRCFHLSMHSINVLQIRTEGLDKCYFTEERAEQACPDPRGPDSVIKPLQEILLFKTRQITGEEITQEFCPISGQFTFTYNLAEANSYECPHSTSQFNNCPSGSELNLKFRRCAFHDHDITFQCLGHWAGQGGQRYLALMDKRQGLDLKQRYRCALYEEDSRTGVIRMAFSGDSTCITGLVSATRGHETMVLSPVPQTRWPDAVEQSSCSFPRWAQGHWENLQVNGNQLTYRDQKSFSVSNIKCVGPAMGENSEKFGIYTRNQCGEDRYSCMWMTRRANNVMELKMSRITSDRFNGSMCLDYAFDHSSNGWQTHGKIDTIQESPCPISGEFLGSLPDNDRLCARLYSDCNNPEIMFFTVYDCTMPADVFEEREYRCLGQWQENGHNYTYTQRKDIGNSYECFAGKIMSDSAIIIMEAGPHCARVWDVEMKGMKLQKQGKVSCLPRTTPTYPTRVPPSQRPYRPTTNGPYTGSKLPQPTPTKPWKTITAPPKDKVSSGAASHHLSYIFLAVLLSLRMLQPWIL